MYPKRIVIDGKTYDSVDEMPDEVRRQYEEAMRGFKEFSTENVPGAMGDLKSIFADKNDDGTPDILEGNPAINLSGGMKFIVDGRSFNSLEDLPPEARAKYEQAMGSLDTNRNGTPDFLEGMLKPSKQTAQSVVSTTAAPPVSTTRHDSRAPLTGTPAITPDTSNGWALALMGLFLLMFCALGAIGIWYFILR